VRNIWWALADPASKCSSIDQLRFTPTSSPRNAEEMGQRYQLLISDPVRTLPRFVVHLDASSSMAQRRRVIETRPTGKIPCLDFHARPLWAVHPACLRPEIAIYHWMFAGGRQIYRIYLLFPRSAPLHTHPRRGRRTSITDLLPPEAAIS